MNKFKPTKPQLRRAWHYYNAVVFNGVLKQLPRFSFNQRKLYGEAWQNNKNYHIAFGSKCKNLEHYIDTLLHEMVHQWQDENIRPLSACVADKDGHGECFKIWREPVRKVYPSEDYDD